MRSVFRQAHSETAFFLRRSAPFLCYLFRLSCTMSIPFRTTSERDIFSSCVQSSSFFTVSLLTRTNILPVMESSEGGLPAFFGAIVSPLFLVRTLIILLYAQKVNTFYDKTQFICYFPVYIPILNQPYTCPLTSRILTRFSLCAKKYFILILLL